MNINLISRPLTTSEEVKRSLEAMRKSSERARKDPKFAWELLMSTGMYTKTGKIKKQFR